MIECGFYVYEHWRPDLGVCFYVGKGILKRATSLVRKENPRHLRVIEKLSRFGMKAEVKIIVGPVSEQEAFGAEIERIAYWRATAPEKLVNMTDGGEGASGMKHSEAFRARQREINRNRTVRRGHKLTEEHKAKISAGNMGRVVTAETRAKMSASQKGKKKPPSKAIWTDEMRERMRNRVFTAEHRARISAAKRGKPNSEAHKASMSAAMKGRKHSPESYAKAADKLRGRTRPQSVCMKISETKRANQAIRDLCAVYA